MLCRNVRKLMGILACALWKREQKSVRPLPCSVYAHLLDVAS